MKRRPGRRLSEKNSRFGLFFYIFCASNFVARNRILLRRLFVA